ncbi:hypothetical protein NMY22_g3679 [Coprinellus aureogranulatus]|nr:hypothetical protein NMY22_g3679 [Coprinellus aureogranulatus]
MTHQHALQDPAVRAHFKLVAISTTNETSALSSATHYSEIFGHPIKAYWGDASQIANDPEVDLVAMSVKVPYHKEIALKVIEAGKDFFLEWQAGRSVEETRELAEKARERGVRSLIGLQARHGGILKKAKEIVEEGKLGTLLSVNANFLLPREAAMTPHVLAKLRYTLDPENHVNLVNIPGGHFFDAFFHVLGPLARIRATGTILYPTVTLLDDTTSEPTSTTLPATYPDHITVNGILKDSGAWVTVTMRQGHKSTPGRTQLLWEVDGEDGTLKIEDTRMLGMNVGFHDPEHLFFNGEEVIWDAEKEGHEKYESPAPFLRDNWLAFYKGKENGANYMDIEGAVKHREFLAAIETSLQEGRRWIDL